MIKKYYAFISQAPDVPESTHQGIFRLLRLSVNNLLCENDEKYSLYLNLMHFMQILSVQQHHSGNHINFTNYFQKIILFMVLKYLKFWHSTQLSCVEVAFLK